MTKILRSFWLDLLIALVFNFLFCFKKRKRINVVLLCLTAETIEQFQSIILEKEFANQNGQLHSKVFSITFGDSLASLWPPKGLKKGSTDLRDFHFGFSDVDKLRPEDFENSPRLNSLVAAIKLTSWIIISLELGRVLPCLWFGTKLSRITAPYWLFIRKHIY